MFVREFGLVHNPSNSERYVRLVRWETGWHAAGDGTNDEVKRSRPLTLERVMLDVSNPRAYDYAGPVFKLVTTVVTEGRWERRPPWPSGAPTETEELRRERIRILRRACHVDSAKGETEPAWVVPPRSGVLVSELAGLMHAAA